MIQFVNQVIVAHLLHYEPFVIMSLYTPRENVPDMW